MLSTRILLLSFLSLFIFVTSCNKKTDTISTAETKEEVTINEEKETYEVKEFYSKKEVDIVMRDGTKLHTTIYSPKDTSKKYPILMQRTPYSSRPYGEDQFRSKIGPNEFLMKEGNIVVYQDVRGRWMSEGVYDNMRAYIPNKKR